MDTLRVIGFAHIGQGNNQRRSRLASEGILAEHRLGPDRRLHPQARIRSRFPSRLTFHDASRNMTSTGMAQKIFTTTRLTARSQMRSGPPVWFRSSNRARAEERWRLPSFILPVGGDPGCRGLQPGTNRTGKSWVRIERVDGLVAESDTFIVNQLTTDHAFWKTRLIGLVDHTALPVKIRLTPVEKFIQGHLLFNTAPRRVPTAEAVQVLWQRCVRAVRPFGRRCRRCRGFHRGRPYRILLHRFQTTPMAP